MPQTLAREEYMLEEKESELVKKLKSRNHVSILEAISEVTQDKNLMSIEKVKHYCQFIPAQLTSPEYTRLDNENKRKGYIEGVCDLILERLIKKIIEQKSIKETPMVNAVGKFDSHAERFIKLLENGHGDLLKDELIKKSYDVVKAHYQDQTHSADYEMRLNHLHGIFYDLERKTTIKCVSNTQQILVNPSIN